MEPMLFDENGFVRKTRRFFWLEPITCRVNLSTVCGRTGCILKKMGKTLMEMNFDPNEVKILRLKH